MDCIQPLEASQFCGTWLTTATQIFIGYPHRWYSVLDMEEKIARLFFSGPKLPKGNSLLHVKSLARAVIECNLAFVESKILLNTEILSVRSTLTDLNECVRCCTYGTTEPSRVDSELSRFSMNLTRHSGLDLNLNTNFLSHM